MTDNFPSPHVAGKDFDRNIFVTSDTHYGHANIIKYCNRPFSSVEEMNEVMIERHNAVVREKDIIYHLGDVYMSMKGKFLEKLTGRKRLILGNHDTGKDQYLHQFFQKIDIWRMWPEFNLLLSHVPVHASSLYKVKANLHGHIHQNLVMDEKKSSEWGLVPDDRYINACVEHNDYRPVNIEEFAARVKA